MYTFSGRRSGIRLEGEQIGDRRIAVGQIYFGSIHNFLARFIAARDSDGLGAVMGLLAASAARLASLRASVIGRLRQFVSGVINNIPLGLRWRNKWLKTGNALRKNDHGDEEEALDQPGAEQSTIGEDADGRFSGQSLGRSR